MDETDEDREDRGMETGVADGYTKLEGMLADGAV
jgi:hypothetical protein